MRSLSCVGLAGMMMVVAGAPITLAQPPKGAASNTIAIVQPIEAYGMISPVSLATYPPVQKEAGITDEQVAKVKVLRKEASVEFGKLVGELYGGTPAEREAKGDLKAKHIELVQKITDKYRPKLAEVLNAEQIERVDQIAIQAIGEQAYSYPSVVAALKLSKEQQDKVAAIHKEFSDKMKAMGGLGGAGVGSLAERMGRANEFQATRLEKLKAVLTPEQRDEFEQMKGEPFDVKLVYRSSPAP